MASSSSSSSTVVVHPSRFRFSTALSRRASNCVTNRRIQCSSSSERQMLFSRIAPVYDQLNDLLSLGQHRVWKRMAVSWSAAKSGDLVLDLCCGSGDLAFLLSQQVGTDGKVFGLDFSREQLLRASSRQYSLSKSCYNNIDWIEGDALNLPFTDCFFDAVTCGYGLRNVIDKQKAMDEMFRVLKPGSKISILDFNKSRQPLAASFQEWMIDNVVVPAARAYGLEEEYVYLKSSIQNFLTGKELENLALHSGFSVADHYEIAGGLMGCSDQLFSSFGSVVTSSKIKMTHLIRYGWPMEFSLLVGRSLEFSIEPCDTGKWAVQLLTECARAITQKDSSKIHNLLWMLNELASPYGDCDQKIASYFLQVLFCKATESGQRSYKTLISVADKSYSFDSARRLILKFQEVSPWTTFGHVASNGAILEALDGENKLHIIDMSNTLCTQWPTLLEALATRNVQETPHLKLTVVVTDKSVKTVMKDVTQRMEKFARLMGVPFEFKTITELSCLTELTKDMLSINEEDAVAVNCNGALRRSGVNKRKSLIHMLESLHPKVVTIVEEEADFTSTRNDFMKCFEECLNFFTNYFHMLDESFTQTSNERLVLERECSRNIVRILSCHENDEPDNDAGECERRERGTQWAERLKPSLLPINFSDDVVDDVKALLKRYRTGWDVKVSKQPADGDNPFSTGVYLMWKEQPLVWASAWKPRVQDCPEPE